MEELNFGYVKILTGVQAGRIGRYVSDDSEKARVYFGYHADCLRFQNYRNCSLLQKANITNDISKRDLVDRYFSIVRELDSIDLTSHKHIKKHSAGHTDLITECNIIRALLRERHSPALLDRTDAMHNALLLFSFKDALWVNDFSLGLEEKGFTAVWDDHESWAADRMRCLKSTPEACYTFIFAVTRHSIRESWFREELRYLKSICDTGSHHILCVKSDDVHVPAWLGEVYDLQNQFSDGYYRNFDALMEQITL